jgi:SPP1 family phage portal protein
MVIKHAGQDKLSTDEVLSYWKLYEASGEVAAIKYYESYYDVHNAPLKDRIKDRERRNKKPNNFVPTAYYKTVVDSMAGYLFSEIVYKSEDGFQEKLREYLSSQDVEVKDMANGIESLALNKAIEYVYTVGDKNVDVKFSRLNPKSVALIYTAEIEPTLFCGIWCHDYKDNDYTLDVIYSDSVVTYKVHDDIITLGEYKQLPFDEVPICLYETQVIGDMPPFHQILAYIDALDGLISGNSNEIDRIVDAILVLGKALPQEAIDHMDEWKVLQGMRAEDRAEYLTKDMSPAFREYVSKLLIQEIHKHSHVVDWYNPDTGISGATSGKALKTRLFDMDVYSKRIEKIYRRGIKKRIRLISSAWANMYGEKPEEVEVVFKRTMINDFEDKVQALTNATFLSSQTKVEEAGLNWETEKERLSEEALERGLGYGDIDTDGIEGADLDVVQESDVKAVVLNGAQVTAAKAIANEVAAGELPRESGIQLVMALGIPREQAEKIVPAEGKKVVVKA